MKMTAAQNLFRSDKYAKSEERLENFNRAIDALGPTLVALQGRISAIRDTLDYLAYQYCLNETMCEHLAMADAPIDRFLRVAQFLKDVPKQEFLTTRAKAYNYRELLRVMFELHPPIAELSRPGVEFAGIKKGAWEMLQFKLNLAVMELDQIMHHPQFMEHAMAIEEIVMQEA